jgi:hypothetical protein
MPQLSVTQNAIPAQPGMLFDATDSANDVVSAVCSVNIPFGVLCELTSTGQAQPVQDATILTPTATTSSASTSVTMSANVTLTAGTGLVFSSQPTEVYYVAQNVTASTSVTIDKGFTGSGTSGQTVSLVFNPNLLGISKFDPLGVEQNYTTWTVPSTLTGTVNVVNNATGITFSTNQTLAQGTPVVFSSQPGVQYFIAQAGSATTAYQLTTAYGGPSNGAATTTLPGQGSTSSGWKAGMVAPFVRRGRIWVAGDASGTAVQYGPINVHHSSTGTNPQGVFTFLAAPVFTAGNEIDVAPGCTVWNPGLGYSAQYTDPFGNVFSMYVVSIHIG